MSNDIKKRGLGRGLDALFRDAKTEEKSFEAKNATVAQTAVPAAEAPRETPVKRADEVVKASAAIQQQAVPANGVRKMAVTQLIAGASQPRRYFDEAALNTLADSIRLHGVLQPILVRPKGNSQYEIIAGERRWRAAQLASLHEVPVVIREMTDLQAMEYALIENLQREDLSAIEEAEGYQRLIEQFGYTQETLGKQLGKSRSHVTNTLRLLTLPPLVRAKVHSGNLSAGHARALVGVPKAEHLAETIIKRDLSVRQVEKLVKSMAEGKKPAALGKKVFVEKDVDILALEQKITSQIGLKVLIDGEGSQGKLVIEYKSLDQLDDVIKRLVTTPSRG